MHSRRFLTGLLILSWWLPAERAARAQQIKGRVMVMVDTSGSMVWHFNNNNSTGGDGDLKSLFTDSLQANKNYYPGNLINGVPDGTNSRIYAAKAALTNVVNATGDIDFGLMRYAPANVGNGCQNNVNCCNFGTPECTTTGGYVNNGGKLTWVGNCGPVTNGLATDGGQILVPPLPGSSKQAATWVDGVEDFRDNGKGQPLNGELRANGSTPLAGSARTALAKWYQPILNYSRANPNCVFDPVNTPLCDPQIDCRPYVFVQMTDGADTCDGNANTGPPAAVKALHDANLANPPLTYVIGLAFIQGDPAIAVLNNMAASGGTGTARFANNQAAIEAALGDIVSSSVKVELCNNKDDNCNAVVDEGFDKGAGCTVGVGACQRTGIKKCDPMNNTQTACCVDDKLPNGACVPLMAGAPGQLICDGKTDNNCNGIIDAQELNCPQPQDEVCDGKDNDLDGVIDDHLVDVGAACGLALGQCKAGKSVCQNSMGQDVTQMGVKADAKDKLVCVGAVGPQAELCNGFDDDCDGIVDGMTRPCYGGPMGTQGVGICSGGLQRCVAAPGSGLEMWSACVGEVKPQIEVCNAIDDDCDGMIDDVAGANMACCPSGLCGKGICMSGLMQCSGGALACVGGQGPRPEVCNGIDDDCNSKVDDLANLGMACVAPNGCPGTETCDVMKMMEVCIPTQVDCMGMMNDCNNDPRVGKDCGPGVGLPGACRPGKYVCVNSVVLCQGGVGPSAEACNCLDDDCNGKVDDGALCAGGTACFMCQCASACDPGEFPCASSYDCIKPACTVDADCPGGNACDPKLHQCVPGFCVASSVCMPACPDGFDCKGGTCVDRCAGVMCPAPLTCDKGNCFDKTCRALHNCAGCSGGAGGEKCDITLMVPACVPDPCCGKDCGAGFACDSTDGSCLPTCAGKTCGQGQCCTAGQCGPCDRCNGVSCGEGQKCDPRTGACVADKCRTTFCGLGTVCCDGSCKTDTCSLVHCPAGTRCVTNTFDCSHSCELPKHDPNLDDKVLAAGGGGLALGCDAGQGRAPSSSAATVAGLAFALATLVLRRRRAVAVAPARDPGRVR